MANFPVVVHQSRGQCAQRDGPRRPRQTPAPVPPEPTPSASRGRRRSPPRAARRRRVASARQRPLRTPTATRQRRAAWRWCRALRRQQRTTSGGGPRRWGSSQHGGTNDGGPHEPHTPEKTRDVTGVTPRWCRSHSTERAPLPVCRRAAHPWHAIRVIEAIRL